MKFSHIKLCLGSASPRRAELLQQMDVSFEVGVANIDESIRKHEKAADYVMRMAIEKARRVWQINQGTALAGLPVLAADTAVVLDDWIMGKPADREQGGRNAKRPVRAYPRGTDFRIAVVWRETNQSTESK